MVDNPPVNALSPGVPEEIKRAIAEIVADEQIKAAVLIGAGATFIAGADIREFEKFAAVAEKESKNMLPLMLAMEDCPKPVVAAIHGTAYGGGLEVAQAAHFRVAAPQALLGQPEVKLGIIPGAAGTQRLPRLVGTKKAVEMCAFGEPVTAQLALEIGLVDRIIEGDLLAGAIEFAREQATENVAPPKTRERNDKLKVGEDFAAIFDRAREKAHKTKRGMNAPLAAIEAVEAASRMPFAKGCQFERDLFFKQLASDESKSLIHVFFAEREAAKIPDGPKDMPVLEIKKAAVSGAGTMGGGIAMNYANAGIPVILKETTQEALDKGVSIIQKNYANSVKKGRFSAEEMERRMSLITPTLDYDGFETADIVTEAVFEGMALKKEIFGALDKICKPTAILASNTSTLDIDEIAAATSRSQMVIAHHFFSPANVMRLLEIVRGRETSKEVIATSLRLAKKLRKIGVLVGNCHGFPAWRGGPMFYADTVGLEKVYERVVEFGRQHGDWWQPANLLKDLAEGGKRFADFDRAGLAKTSK